MLTPLTLNEMTTSNAPTQHDHVTNHRTTSTLRESWLTSKPTRTPHHRLIHTNSVLHVGAQFIIQVNNDTRTPPPPHTHKSSMATLIRTADAGIVDNLLHVLFSRTTRPRIISCTGTGRCSSLHPFTCLCTDCLERTLGAQQEINFFATLELKRCYKYRF